MGDSPGSAASRCRVAYKCNLTSGMSSFSVIPAQAEIHEKRLDSRLRGNDGTNNSHDEFELSLNTMPTVSAGFRRVRAKAGPESEDNRVQISMI
jgi:hypothetical protein